MTGPGSFRLPSAWRCVDREGPGEFRVEVPYADLSAALEAFAAEPWAVPAAAHIKVLGMLVEEPAFGLDAVLTSLDHEVRVLPAEPGAARTWRELVEWVGQAVRAFPQLATPVADPAAQLDRALFVTEASVLDELVESPDPALRYGLRVGVDVETRTLILQADGFLRRADADRLASMYRRVLEAMAERPDGDAATALLPDGERSRVLHEWSSGPAADCPAATVVELFRDQAAKTPDAIAVRMPGRTLTFQELDLRSEQIAWHLVGRGARRDVPVGVCLRRGPDLLPTLLGVWKAGAAYLPLDPGLPAQRLRHMISAAGCALVVSRSEYVPLLEPLDEGEFLLLDQDSEAIDALPRTPVDRPAGPADLAYVIYTSGSTGVPKGVMVHHGGLANYLLWTADEYAARGAGGSPHFSSIGFDLGVPSLFTPLLVGQTVDLLPDPLDPADLGALLAAGAPYSFIKMTPGHLNMLSTDLTAHEAGDLAGIVIAAGDAFPVEVARRWSELAGPGGPPVATEYGPTEITVGNSGQPVTRLGADGLIPLGTPIPNTTMYVLDDRLEPVPEGVPGEVCVGGAGVVRGYLGAPALTAERFVPDPYGPPGSRLYRTGDRGRWRSGDLEFLGRTDHQVKIRGYRVEPGEVAAALQRRPEVVEAVVIAHAAPSGAQRLAAFVVPAPHSVLDPRRLREQLGADLPDFMVPSVVVGVDEIPLTANGKVDAGALRALL